MYRIFVLALLLGVALPLQAQQSYPIGSPIAFVDINVIPMDRERVLARHTVIVRHGHIIAVGPSGEVEVPADALRIDGRGKYLLPGLADMHSHAIFLGTEGMALNVANGVTTVREMSGGPGSLELRAQIARGRLLGPNVYTAGPMLEGASAPEVQGGNTGWVLISSPLEAVTAVARQKAAGYDFIKVRNNIPRAAYNFLVAAANAHGLRVSGHVPFEVGLDGVFEAGQTTIEHLRGYIWHLVPADAPQQPGKTFVSRATSWQYADHSRMPALARATKEVGVFNTPTLGFPLVQLGTPEAIARYRSRPGGAYLPPPRLVRRESWYNTFTDEDFQAVARGYPAREALVRALRDAGAKILAGTDVGPVGFALHAELENLVHAGLTPYEVLEAATRNAAEALGQLDRFGTVAVGKRADLILVSANPLDDITNAARLDGVMVSGRWHPGEELKRLLEEIREARQLRYRQSR